jgi:plasmid maintenance system antidote protein VapI
MTDPSFQADWFSKPGDTLLTLMEQRELSAETLASKLGCGTALVQGVLAGTANITPEFASALATHLGGTAKFWESRQDRFEAGLDKAVHNLTRVGAVDWIDNFPHSDLTKFGWVPKARAQDEKLRAYLRYFGVSSPDEWTERYAKLIAQTAFRTSQTYESKIGPLSAWLRQAELQAAQQRTDRWNPTEIAKRIDALRVLTKAKNPGYFLPRMRRLCAECGLAVVFVRTPPGCAASGATRFLSAKKAMLVLSFRYLSDDHFWFTFFHELGHLLLHSSETTFIDGEDPDSSDIEKEANAFSEQVLIPLDRREEMLDLGAGREKIIRFAYSVGVSPGIVVGQMQHHRAINPNQMNHLKRRFNWQQISSVAASP